MIYYCFYLSCLSGDFQSLRVFLVGLNRILGGFAGFVF